MNTLDMPTNYVPALDEQDAVAKDVSLPVDLMALIDDYAGDDWSNEGDDLLAALGGESYEQALEDGVTLLDGVCGLPEEDILNFVTECAAAAPNGVKVEPKQSPSPVPDELPGCCTPIRESEVFEPVLSPFSMNAPSVDLDKAVFHPGEEIWAKFEFPTDACNEKKPVPDLYEYSKKFANGFPQIDWDAELAAEEEPVQAKKPKKECVDDLDIMWSAQNHNRPVEMLHRPKPMLTPAQLRRKLMANSDEESLNASRVVAVTPDNALPLANRSTTVPAASAVKSRPMRSLLNTQKQTQNVKSNSRSLLLPAARSKSQELVTPSDRDSKTVKTVSARVPPADSSVHKKCSRKLSTDDAPIVMQSDGSPRPETPQSIAESEDEAPMFRHNTIDTILTSTLCDATPSSTMYLTPSDSSGSPKSTFYEDYDDDDEDDDDEDYDDEDYEPEEACVSDNSNMRSPPEAVIREERPARTVLPYISDHSYHLSKTNVRTDNLGVQTPSDSEEEIDVVSVGGDKSSARLPNNPSARDRRQLQQKVASAIHRNGGRQPQQYQYQQTSPGEAAAVSGKKRQQQAAAAAGRGGGQAKRARLQQAPGQRGRRRANSDEEPDPCEKRSMHNSMERQRRIDLRNLVEKLRLLVPATEGNKRAAKVVILREAAEYCRINTPILHKREAMLEELRERQKVLMARLSQLRAQLAAARLQEGEE